MYVSAFRILFIGSLRACVSCTITVPWATAVLTYYTVSILSRSIVLIRFHFIFYSLGLSVYEDNPHTIKQWGSLVLWHFVMNTLKASRLHNITQCPCMVYFRVLNLSDTPTQISLVIPQSVPQRPRLPLAIANWLGPGRVSPTLQTAVGDQHWRERRGRIGPGWGGGGISVSHSLPRLG